MSKRDLGNSLFAYSLKHAMRGLRRNPLFTVLMELSLGFGVALWTVGHTGVEAHYDTQLSRPETLYHVELTREMIVEVPRGRNSEFWDRINAILLTYRDALALADATGRPHTISYSTPVVVTANEPESVWVRFTTGALFSMFERTFIAGEAWSAEADSDALPQCVLAKSYAKRVFGDAASAVGKTLGLGDERFVVTGVVEDDRKVRRLYDFTAYPDHDSVFVPLRNLERLRARPTNYYPWHAETGRFSDITHGEMAFLHVFVQLPDAAAKRAYEEFLTDYIAADRATSREPRLSYATVRSLASWTDMLIASPYLLFQLFALLGFITCIFNLARLLMAKFWSRADEVAIRRALGATRRTIFLQHLLEAELVAVGGTVLGLALAAAGLLLVNNVISTRPVDFALDFQRAMLAAASACIAGALAGIYPALRICNVPPAAALRRQ